MSVFCSNTLIFAPEFWKCNLRGPDCKMFLEPCPYTLLVTCAFGPRRLRLWHEFFPSPPTPKLFATYLKPYGKPCTA